jgi:hypothetical protein
METMKITKDDGQYILNQEDQVTVFDSAHIVVGLLILKRRVKHFNPADISGNDFIQDVGIATLFDKAMKKAINQLKELGMVITNESEKVGV